MPLHASGSGPHGILRLFAQFGMPKYRVALGAADELSMCDVVPRNQDTSLLQRICTGFDRTVYTQIGVIEGTLAYGARTKRSVARISDSVVHTDDGRRLSSRAMCAAVHPEYQCKVAINLFRGASATTASVTASIRASNALAERTRSDSERESAAESNSPSTEGIAR